MRSILQKSTLPYGAIIAISSVLILFFGILLAAKANAEPTIPVATGEHLITIHDRGQDRGILTSAKTLREAFKQAGVAIDPSDKVEPALDETLVASHYDVNIYRARPVTVVDGSRRIKIMSAYQTPEQIVKHADIKLQDEDITTINANSDMVSQGAGLQLSIDRATPFTFVLYGKTLTSFTQAATVGEMLQEKKITLGKDDVISHADNTPIVKGMTVDLWRNGIQTITEDEEVPFEVEQIQDADREIGYKDIKTPGEKGKRTVSYEIEMKNGKEISRKEIQSVVTKEPKKQVEVVGTKYPAVIGPEEVLSRINHWSNARGIDANRVARIAKCESGFNPQADSGYYKGLFQHDPNYWPARAAKYGQAGASIFDPEAQIIVSTAMMAEGGWSHWGCK